MAGSAKRRVVVFSAATLFLSISFGVGYAERSEGHRSGCHRWHSCPSDSGSYTCGDTGHGCNGSGAAPTTRAKRKTVKAGSVKARPTATTRRTAKRRAAIPSTKRKSVVKATNKGTTTTAPGAPVPAAPDWGNHQLVRVFRGAGSGSSPTFRVEEPGVFTFSSNSVTIEGPCLASIINETGSSVGMAMVTYGGETTFEFIALEVGDYRIDAECDDAWVIAMYLQPV